ncbi:MAG TPA: heme-binding protein [Polyangiaceae bacterium]
METATRTALVPPTPTARKRSAIPLSLRAKLESQPHVRRDVEIAGGIGASLAIAGLASLLPRGPARTIAMTIGGASAAGLVLVRSQLARAFAEQPAYVIERNRGPIEIRRYDGSVTASIFVTSEIEDVTHESEKLIDRGFHALFDYIRGQNETGEKLPMSAPVTFEPGRGGAFVSFFLPASRTLPSLPKPLDHRITLAWNPRRCIAAFRYGGCLLAKDRQETAERVARSARTMGYEPEGAPIFAGFDAPYVVPFLRRSEVWLEV